MSFGGDTRSDHLSPRRATKAPGPLLDRAKRIAAAHEIDGRPARQADVVTAALVLGLQQLEERGLQHGLDAVAALAE